MSDEDRTTQRTLKMMLWTARLMLAVLVVFIVHLLTLTGALPIPVIVSTIAFKTVMILGAVMVSASTFFSLQNAKERTSRNLEANTTHIVDDAGRITRK